MIERVYTTAFSKILKPVLDDKIKVIVCQGGASASKTYSILQLIDEWAERSKKKRLFSITSESFPHLQRGCIRDYIKILDQEYSNSIHNKTRNIINRNDSEVEFFSCDSSDKVRGARRDVLFVNEVNNVPRETFEQLEIRTDEKVFVDFNPVSEFYIHEMLDRPDFHFLKLTPYDNEMLSKRIWNSMLIKAERDPNFKRVYIDGEIGNLEGVIFPNIIIIDEMPENFKKERYGLDYGFTNDPTALIHCGLNNNKVYFDEIIYKTGLTNQDIDEEMNDACLRKGYDQIIADCSEPKSIEELNRLGWFIEACVKGKDSIMHGINVMKQLIIHVTKRSINLIKEFRNYQWIKHKIDSRYLNKPIDSWNHGIDACRYAVMDMFGSEIRITTL